MSSSAEFEKKTAAETAAATTDCAQPSFRYIPAMPTEISTVDAEDLKSRLSDLRRFL
jgi:hypothetical protein